MTTKAVRLTDIRPNPFRNIDRYPINRDKVEKLKGSIERTDFWDNLVARIASDGQAEIAYGHHRMVALRELYPTDHKINLIVRDFDDASMLHSMADENMKEWGSTQEVTTETVRAVRDYLGVSGPARKRPHGAADGKSNGAADIVAFLGWPKGRVEDALGIIYAEERGEIEPEDTAGLDLEQATHLRRAVSRIAKPEVKRAAISRVRDDLREGRIGRRGIRDVVNEVQHEAAGAAREKPVVPATIAASLFADIEDYWRKTLPVGDRNVTRSELLRLIAENRNTEELTRSVRPWADQLADALERHASEAMRLAELLRAEQAVAIGA